MKNYRELGQSAGIDETTRRGNGAGEPSLTLSNGHLEAYKAGLKKCGVPDEDIVKCAQYIVDPQARDRRSSVEKTVDVEQVTPNNAFDALNTYVATGRNLANEVAQESRGRRAFKKISRLLITTQSTRQANKEAVNGMRDPISTARKAIEDLAAATNIEISSDEPSSDNNGAPRLLPQTAEVFSGGKK